MDKEFGLLNDDEVLYVRAGRVLMSNPTFKVSEFLDVLAQLISEREEEWQEEQEGWFTDRGASCEVLRFGNQGWQRGRVRIRLEFCPERSPKLLRESSLPPEEAYRREEVRRSDDPYRRRNREDIYRRDNPQLNTDQEIYPEIDEEY
ncbi:MAG: KGK domain-containing protein [Cyanobacteria bacterium CRU_2_1]|nr:KGK domain-containing protein [Cyanobacteria bacterium CRU_2_1]